MPFEALFVPDELRYAVSDRAWVEAMLKVERALADAQGHTLPELEVDPAELAVEARSAGNPVEPLVRRLREVSEHAHRGATSQDVMDTAAMLVASRGRELIGEQLWPISELCAGLAEEHRATVMAGRTLLQQAVPITFGLKVAEWLVGIVHATTRLALVDLPVQLGGAAGTLAAFGDEGLELREALALELELDEPAITWHSVRTPIFELAGALDGCAAVLAKIALDIALLSQTEVAEVRERARGGSSTMPHKGNPVASTLARACAAGAHAAAGVLTGGVHEHERAAGAWHAEWKALSDALALTGAAAAWVRRALDGLEVDGERMRANLRAETMSEAERFAPDAREPEQYLGATNALIDAALHLHRDRYR